MLIEKTVGVLGGGQLGRMMAEAGHRIGACLATTTNTTSFDLSSGLPPASVDRRTTGGAGSRRCGVSRGSGG